MSNDKKDLWTAWAILAVVSSFMYFSFFPDNIPFRNVDIPFPHELYFLLSLLFLLGPRSLPVKIGMIVLVTTLGLIVYLGAPYPYPGVLLIGGFAYYSIYRLIWWSDAPLPKVEVYIVSFLFVIITVAMIYGVNQLSLKT